MKSSHLLLILALLTLLTLSQAAKCPKGQVPDLSRNCICPQPIEACLQYETPTSCSKCSYRYKLTPEGLCSLTNPTEPCCAKEKENGECQQCREGLILVDGRCEERVIPGCLEMNDQGVCVNCGSDFEIMLGKCQKRIKNCEDYKDVEGKIVCDKCEDGYNLMNNACVKSVILGCEQCKNSKCVQCYAPFKKVQNHCEIENCKNYNEYGCTYCQCGFYLTKQGICEEMMDGCLRYQRGVCTDCQPHFSWKNSKCIIQGCKEVVDNQCQACEDGYAKEKGGCRLEKKCDYWLKGECKFCEKGQHYLKGKCVKLIEAPIFHGGLRRMKS